MMTDKELYEELGAIAEQLPEAWREHLAVVVYELLQRGVNSAAHTRDRGPAGRWLKDAGYSRR